MTTRAAALAALQRIAWHTYAPGSTEEAAQLAIVEEALKSIPEPVEERPYRCGDCGESYYYPPAVHRCDTEKD